MCERPCPLDFVLRGSFEWRELANLLSSFGRPQPGAPAGEADGDGEAELGERVYRESAALAHRSRPFGQRLVKILACMHGAPIAGVRGVERRDLRLAMDRPPRRQDVGLYWALLTDPRADVAALAREWARRAPPDHG